MHALGYCSAICPTSVSVSFFFVTVVRVALRPDTLLPQDFADANKHGVMPGERKEYVYTKYAFTSFHLWHYFLNERVCVCVWACFNRSR